jgi:hypothetical protein
MGTYFDVNIKEIFQIKDNPLNVGIYKNGFYIDDEKKLMVLDIKNKKTTLYSFDEELRQYGDKFRLVEYYGEMRKEVRLWIHYFITNDGKILLMKVDTYGNDLVVYKYEL